MAGESKQLKCEVIDGREVKACHALNAEAGYTVRHNFYMNTKSGARTRDFFTMIRPGAQGRAMALNFCPFCGTRIDAPFNDDRSSEAVLHGEGDE
jgi:hypothetical protein